MMLKLAVVWNKTLGVIIDDPLTFKIIYGICWKKPVKGLMHLKRTKRKGEWL